jgi:hypothetical protein
MGFVNFMGQLSDILGRWNAEVSEKTREYAAWFEIEEENGELKGRFVGIEGSQRPMREITYKDNTLYIRLPPQYENHPGDLIFKGRLEEGKIVGLTNDAKGNWVKFSADPAPELEYRNVEWREPISLIKNDLSNWEKRFPENPCGWKISEGVLSNTTPSVDISTREKFSDFKLHAEFRVPENGNSGIYLRGRYEVQIIGDYGKPPSSRSTGSVYGYIKPRKNMTKPIGQWNIIDITLIGRWVTIILNDQIIIDNEEIPGITGGALDSKEALPGPIMLQGDHREVEYRSLVITPSK